MPLDVADMLLPSWSCNGKMSNYKPLREHAYASRVRRVDIF
jgi:hypothetical protein